MKVLNLVGRKHPALHQVAARIEEPTPEIKQLADRLLATVRVRRGIAIAAPQVGVPIQLVVTSSGNAFLNPTVEDMDEGEIISLEACLSIPGRKFRVSRPKSVQISATTFDGNEVDILASGVGARMWCHESDHLNGVLISDRWPEVRR